MAYELMGLPPEGGILKPICLLDKHENKPITDFGLAENIKTFLESSIGCQNVFIRTIVDIEELNSPHPITGDRYFDL